MPISEQMRKIMDLARRSEASDIHIIANQPPLFRINGEIVLANTPPLTREDTLSLAMGLLNEEQKKTFEKDWQLCCSLFDEGLGRFRVSIYYQAHNPEMSIRPVNQQIKSREKLRLPEQIEHLARFSSGLILITGPTGSGKTTTMNYIIDLINSERRCKIITIEDPVEYVHIQKKAIVVQQELYTDVKSFSSALVHVLRQDPNVICIGEMRDYDTIATALVAAETGHLVIATCHTPNSLQTIDRIISVFPSEQQEQAVAQLSSCLQGILAQRLVPSVNKKQRLLASELLIVNAAARNNIREKNFHLLINVLQTGRKQGMHLMDDSLLAMYEQGLISYDTVINTAHDPIGIKDRIHKQNTPAED